jgi:hypothetical protein
MPRQIVGSDQFAPNAIAFSLGGEAFMIYCVHPTASDFPHGRGLAAARKGILLTVFGFRARLANRQIAAIVRQAFQCGNFTSFFFESSQRAVPEHRISNHHLRKPNLTIYRAINYVEQSKHKDDRSYWTNSKPVFGKRRWLHDSVRIALHFKEKLNGTKVIHD